MKASQPKIQGSGEDEEISDDSSMIPSKEFIWANWIKNKISYKNKNALCSLCKLIKDVESFNDLYNEALNKSEDSLSNQSFEGRLNQDIYYE